MAGRGEIGLAFIPVHGTGLSLKRRSFFLMALGLPAWLSSQGAEADRVRGKLMWDPYYLELPPRTKAPWDRWLAEGVRLRQHEIEVFEFELAKSGRRHAPRAKGAAGFEVPEKPAAWFAGAEAGKIADNLLTWQSPSGGWTKNTAMTRRARIAGQRWSPWGDWGYVATPA
jgi:hypothetical protein